MELRKEHGCKDEKKNNSSYDNDCYRYVYGIYHDYEGVDLDAETKEAMQGYVIDTLTSDNEQAFLGTEGVSYTEGVYSVPMMSSIAYQCVLLRVAPEDVENVKTMLKENADVNKWVCVSAETVLVENVGDVVLFIMSDQEAAYAVSASFQALSQ